MRPYQVLATILLFLGTISVCELIKNDTSTSSAAVCTKKLAVSTTWLPTPQNTAASKSTAVPRALNIAVENITLTSLVKRTDYVMNGPPQWTRLRRSGDELITDGLGGCSIVAIIAKDFAFAIHVSQGSFDAEGRFMNNEVEMAEVAVDQLLHLYYSETPSRRAEVKVLLVTPELPAGKDTVTPVLWERMSDFSSRYIAKYGVYQFNSDIEGSLKIKYAGRNEWPTITLGGNCIDI